MRDTASGFTMYMYQTRRNDVWVVCLSGASKHLGLVLCFCLTRRNMFLKQLTFFGTDFALITRAFVKTVSGRFTCTNVNSIACRRHFSEVRITLRRFIGSGGICWHFQTITCNKYLAVTKSNLPPGRQWGHESGVAESKHRSCENITNVSGFCGKEFSKFSRTYVFFRYRY